MRRVGQARRRDANERAIVDALRSLGVDVTPISGKGAPDLLCRFRGQIYAFECKSSKGQQTSAQQASQWPIVRSLADALRLMDISCHAGADV